MSLAPACALHPQGTPQLPLHLVPRSPNQRPFLKGPSWMLSTLLGPGTGGTRDPAVTKVAPALSLRESPARGGTDPSPDNDDDAECGMGQPGRRARPSVGVREDFLGEETAQLG